MGLQTSFTWCYDVTEDEDSKDEMWIFPMLWDPLGIQSTCCLKNIKEDLNATPDNSKSTNSDSDLQNPDNWEIDVSKSTMELTNEETDTENDDGEQLTMFGDNSF